MAKIKAERAYNQGLAERITEVIQDVVREAESKSEWLTLTVEIQIQAGKFKSLRKVTNEVWQAGAPNGEVLTVQPARA